MEGHINNLYNTSFWALIQQGGLDAKDAEKELAVSEEEWHEGSDLLILDRVLLQRIRMRFYGRGSRLIITTNPRFTRKEVLYFEM